MPFHQINLPIRYDECDAYEHVNHANYIRYMAFAAHSAAESVKAQAGLHSPGHWLVREHNIEYVKPLHFGDRVTIETWVSDFRKVQSLRQYRFLNSAGEEVARASSDWVFINPEDGTLMEIPVSVTEAFMRFNTESDRQVPERSRFPKHPPLPDNPFEVDLPVEWRDVDPQQHVNNAAYFAYNENAIITACARIGWTVERMRKMNMAIVARSYRMQYKAPAVIGDTLRITTWLSDVRRSTAKRHFTIHRMSDNALICRSTAYYVWFDLSKGRIMRIPPEFLADFESNISK